MGDLTRNKTLPDSAAKADFHELIDTADLGVITTQGDILYRGASAAARLAAGSAGQALTTGGASANPAWAGMTTQGDVEYHNGTTRTRLAKGAAGKFLKMNSGATAPEWGDGSTADMTYSDARFAIGSFSRDMSTASSSQAITGVGFAPTALIFFAVTDGAKVASWGFGKNATSGSVCIFHNDIAAADTFSLYSGSGAIMHVVSAGNCYVGVLSSLNSDGFTIGWTKVGSPTGTLVTTYLALR